MKKFEIIEKYNSIIVVPLNNHRMDEIIDDVEHTVASKNYSGTIVFDLLTINGNANNRIIEINFKNSKLDIRNASVVKFSNLQKSILDLLTNYHLNNKNRITDSSLSSLEKRRIIEELESNLVGAY